MRFHEVLLLAALVLSATAHAANTSPIDGTKNKKRGRGSMWWGIVKAGEPNNFLPVSTNSLHMDPAIYTTLRRKQRKLAKENPGVLMAMSNGMNQAIAECQHQFRERRWNCTTKNFIKGKNLFGKIVDKGCRETAFIYAITSASVTHSIARACSEGSIQSCSCDYNHQSRPSSIVNDIEKWEWGGCSDNIGYAFHFSREFVDTGERGRNLREKMNLHNNEAGRAHVSSEMRQECKCHGMSGSCTVKTCWMRLPHFRLVSDNLKDRFDGASRIMTTNSDRIYDVNPLTSNSASNSVHRRGYGRKHRYNVQLKPFNSDHKPPGTKDLVYVDLSPGFCERNSKLGILGTHGRLCNDTSIGVDGCDLMCCGRGYMSQEIMVLERCACMFHWCCEVRCQLCHKKKVIHTCL